MAISKKSVVTLLALLVCAGLVTLAVENFSLAQGVGGRTISVNSPVSFPVDI